MPNTPLSYSRIRIACLAAFAVVGFVSAASAQAWPTKPVRLVVPFPPGGGTDTIARGLAEGLRPIWNQPVIVDNKPGGGQAVGSIAVATAAPDGYTMLVANDATLEYNLFLYSKLDYDPRKFTFVTRLVQVHEMLVVDASVPVTSAKEFVEYARKHEKLLYSSPTLGSPEQIGMESFRTAAGGFPIKHIAYRGMAPALQGVLTGDVQAIVTSALVAAPHIQAGKMKPLAISGNARSASLPNVPTMAEAGYPGVTLGYYLALVAPEGTPPDIASKIATDVKKVLNSPEFKARFVDPFEYQVIGDTPAEFAAFYRDDLPKAEKRVKDSGAKLD